MGLVRGCPDFFLCNNREIPLLVSRLIRGVIHFYYGADAVRYFVEVFQDTEAVGRDAIGADKTLFAQGIKAFDVHGWVLNAAFMA